jgi:ParB-like chromosome segregation protein Spo0J
MTAKQAEDIQKSIEKFGLTDKPLVQPDGTIIGGHQRVKVLKKMGYKEVPVLVADPALTEVEIEEAVIRHNKNTGEFDYEILANQWEIQDLIEWGFEEKELFGIAEVIGDEDNDEEDKPKKAKECPHCGKEID